MTRAQALVAITAHMARDGMDGERWAMQLYLENRVGLRAYLEARERGLDLWRASHG